MINCEEKAADLEDKVVEKLDLLRVHAGGALDQQRRLGKVERGRATGWVRTGRGATDKYNKCVAGCLQDKHNNGAQREMLSLLVAFKLEADLGQIVKILFQVGPREVIDDRVADRGIEL